MSPKEVLQIFILSHERPNYLRETLLSVLQQDFPKDKYNVIVSDNSFSHGVSDMMLKEFPQVKLIRRVPPVDVIEHIRMISNEITAEFFVMFHDDDLMHPDYCRSVLEVFFSDPAVMAVSTNAFQIDATGNRNGIFNNQVSRVSFSDKSVFLTTYLPGLSQFSGVAPFPAYCYRKQALKIPTYAFAGKYTDVVVLTNVLDHGKIVWLPDPLIFYRMHEGNGSGVIDFRAYLKLLRFMNQNGISRDNQAFKLLRKKNWFLWYLQQKKVDRLNYFFLKTLPIPSSWKEAQVHKACLIPPYTRTNSVIGNFVRKVWCFLGLLSMLTGFLLFTFFLSKKHK